MDLGRAGLVLAGERPGHAQGCDWGSFLVARDPAHDPGDHIFPSTFTVVAGGTVGMAICVAE